jgi:hypothetical protein
MLRQALDAYKCLPEPPPQELRVLMLDTWAVFASTFISEVSFMRLNRFGLFKRLS